MNARERQKRFEEFEAPIIEIARNNPIVNRILAEYVHGNIVTKQEALCQMVVALSINWEKQRRDYMDVVAMRNMPTFIVKP